MFRVKDALLSVVDEFIIDIDLKTTNLIWRGLLTKSKSSIKDYLYQFDYIFVVSAPASFKFRKSTGPHCRVRFSHIVTNDEKWVLYSKVECKKKANEPNNYWPLLFNQSFYVVCVYSGDGRESSTTSSFQRTKRFI